MPEINDETLTPASRPPQFSLRGIFVATTIVAILVGIARWYDHEAFSLILAIAMIAFAVWSGWKYPPFLSTAIMLAIIVFILAGLLLPTTGSRRAGRRTQCLNNLKQITTAIQLYESKHRRLPPVVLQDASGQKLHSWRTLLLPYFDRDNLFQRIDLNKSWNNPQNKPFTQISRSELQCPSALPKNAFDTSYVAVIGPDTVWSHTRAISLSEIKDGLADTILLIEMKNSGIAWAEPRDLDLANLPPGVTMANLLDSISPHPGVIHVAFADGHIESVRTTIPVAQLQALFTKSGGEKIDRDSW